MAIEDFQNVVSFMVALTAGINVWSYYYLHNENPDCLPWFLAFAGGHCFMDLFLTRKWDIQLHHICVLALVAYKYMYGVANIHDAPMLLVLYKTELTSAFWVICIWVKQASEGDKKPPLSWWVRPLGGVSFCLFVVLYFQLRVVEYSRMLLDEQVYVDFLQYTQIGWWSHAHIYGALYGLYGLNLYWFAIVLKVAYKSTLYQTGWNTDAVNRRFVSVAYMASFMAAMYLYDLQPEQKFASFPDLLGIVILCASSFFFHSVVLDLRLTNCLPEGGPEEKPLDFTDSRVMVPFLADVAAIHIRCGLCAVTNFYSFPVEVRLPMVGLVCGNHLLAFLMFASVVEKHQQQGWPFDNEAYGKVEWVTGCSIFITTALFAFHCNRYLTTIELMMPLVALYLVSQIKPFYKTNHVLTHVCLFWQTLTLVRANIYANKIVEEW